MSVGVAADERAHRATRARQVAVADRALDPPHVMQQIAEREQAVEKECVDEPRQRHDTAIAAARARDDARRATRDASATNSSTPPP